jgi:ribosome biogenesis GTPase
MAPRKLTKRQKVRIGKIQEQRRQRLHNRAEFALSNHDEDPLTGRVITRHGQNLVIQGENHQYTHCLFRQNLGEVVCGDRVVWQPTHDEEGVVTALLPRDSVLSRPGYNGRDKPLAANITQLVVVLAPEPQPTGYLTDQYLVAAERIGVSAIIALNKADLLAEDEWRAFHQTFAHYEKIGYPVLRISAKQDHGLEALQKHLQHQTSILVGQSGVGKSSLINALMPHKNIEEGKLSDASGLGRHTTSAATLYGLDSGGEIIDSPGVRSFRLGKLTRQELEQGFRDFTPYLSHCQFSNCAHQAEPGCALIEAVEKAEIDPDRLQNFRHMARNI